MKFLLVCVRALPYLGTCAYACRLEMVVEFRSRSRSSSRVSVRSRVAANGGWEDFKKIINDDDMKQN